jgi:polyadenylate-binding protein 2
MNDELDLYSELLSGSGTAGQEDLETLQQQVASMEEDQQVSELQRKAAEDEGTRKTATQALSTSVFLRGLDPRCGESDVRVFFDGCGTIARVTILKDRATGVSRGQAYVEFASEESVNKALLRNNNTIYDKPVSVVLKRENVPGMSRGGRGASFPTPGGFRGRGAMGSGAAPPAAALQAMMQTMMQFSGANFNPSLGRGRGRGRGRGQ